MLIYPTNSLKTSTSFSLASSDDAGSRRVSATATALGWFASDTAHFCIHPYNICGVASTHLYDKEQRY